MLSTHTHTLTHILLGLHNTMQNISEPHIKYIFIWREGALIRYMLGQVFMFSAKMHCLVALLKFSILEIAANSMESMTARARERERVGEERF